MFGASTVHLGIAIPLGFATLRDPFGGAAIPEAVLGMILGIAAVTVLASVRRAWAIGIATTTFAILVVLYGMVDYRARRVPFKKGDRGSAVAAADRATLAAAVRPAPIAMIPGHDPGPRLHRRPLLA